MTYRSSINNVKDFLRAITRKTLVKKLFPESTDPRKVDLFFLNPFQILIDRKS